MSCDSLGDIHAAVLGLPVVKRRFRDAVLARQIRRLRPGLVLLQHPDDLIFREPCSLHLSVLQEGRTLNSPGGKSQWQVTCGSYGPRKVRSERHRLDGG